MYLEYDLGVKLPNVKIQYADLKVYEGTAVDDRPGGRGTLTSPGEGAYVGEFLNGEIHGKGVLTSTRW